MNGQLMFLNCLNSIAGKCSYVICAFTPMRFIVPLKVYVKKHQYYSLCSLLFYFVLKLSRLLFLKGEKLPLPSLRKAKNYCDLQQPANTLKPELYPICYLLALLGAHNFLHVSRIRVKLLTFRRLMSYIYGAPILDVSRSHTTTQHSR